MAKLTLVTTEQAQASIEATKPAPAAKRKRAKPAPADKRKAETAKAESASKAKRKPAPAKTAAKANAPALNEFKAPPPFRTISDREAAIAIPTSTPTCDERPTGHNPQTVLPARSSRRNGRNTVPVALSAQGKTKGKHEPAKAGVGKRVVTADAAPAHPWIGLYIQARREHHDARTYTRQHGDTAGSYDVRTNDGATLQGRFNTFVHARVCAELCGGDVTERMPMPRPQA